MPQNKAQDDEAVMNLVELALAQPPHQREAFLRSVCVGDAELYGEAWKYVQWEQRMQGFLLDPLYAPAASRPAFAPGDVLDGRFSIVREVAEGGMGVVYEAIDETLGRRIAIKCAKIGYRKRLPPEVRHATEISHPNVCKIFEIHKADTDRGPIDFVTMEFLEGETLAERLLSGPLPEHEGREIALQLCSGLAEAHHNRVIHGDLKSNNVILTRTAAGGLRAVITDFGLARRPETTQQTIQSGLLGGTPDYMAPELWRGEKPSVASDIYALGIIIYEMISGRRPFRPEISWEQRLASKPEPVHRKWDRTLLRCLDPDPVQRFATVDQVARSLAPSHTVAPWWTAVAAAAMVFLAVILTYARLAPPRETLRLGVQPVQSDAAAASLSANLSRDISRELSHLTGDPLVRFTTIPSDAAHAKGVTHLLQTSIANESGQIVMRVHLADQTHPGKQTDWTISYAPTDLRLAGLAVAGFVTETLHLPPPPAKPVNAAASTNYWNGVWYTRQNSTLDRALYALGLAVTQDPDSPLPYAALAEAQWFQYFQTKQQFWADQARESLTKAESRNPDTPAAHRVEGYLYYKTGLYGEAQAQLQRAIELQPGNAMGHIWLGRAYEDNNQPTQALDEFQAAGQVEPKYFRTYQNLGAYYQDQSNFTESARNFRTALDLAPKEPGLEGLLAAPCMELGHFSEAERLLRSSLSHEDTVSAEYRLGLVLMYEGRDSDAVPVLQKALQLLDQGTPAGGTSRALILTYLGIAARRLNRTADALELNRAGLDFAKKDMRQNYLDGYVSAFVAYFDAVLGNRAAAEEESQRALSLSPENSYVRWRAVLTYEELYRRFRDQGFRNQTLTVLQHAGAQELADLSRWPDLADLHKDPRFISLRNSHPVEDGGNVCAQ